MATLTRPALGASREKDRRHRSTAGPAGSVDPVSLQTSDERIEVAFGKPAFSDLRDPCQDFTLRGAIAILFDDEPPAAHMYLDPDTGMKSSFLQPAPR